LVCCRAACVRTYVVDSVQAEGDCDSLSDIYADGASSTMETKQVIVPLNDHNYATWKVQVKMALMREELFCIVSGNEDIPADPNSTEYKRFVKRRDKALSIIVLAIEPKLLYLIGDPVDPTEVWNKLRSTFQRKTWANKLRLRRRLYSLKLKTGDNLQHHLKTLIELFEELSVVGDAVEEEDRVIILLASLPDSFSTMVTALEALDSVPTWEIVTERLRHEDAKQLGQSKTDNSAALTVKTSKKTVKCYECGKLGHIRRNCRVWLAKSSKANCAAVPAEENVILCASAMPALNHGVRNPWILDSGASQHMCRENSYFSSLTNFDVPKHVVIGDGRTLEAVAYGKVDLKLRLPNKQSKLCTLDNVLLVPNLSANLISISKVAENGNKVEFAASNCKVFNVKNSLIAAGIRIGKLYYLCHDNDYQSDSAMFASDDKAMMWHKRFGHIGFDNLKKLIDNKLVRGITDNVEFKSNFFCENCVAGKITRQPFPKHNHRRSKPLELIHSDICGPITPSSLGGGKYILTFIDDCTRFLWTYILAAKNETFGKFKEFKLSVENQLGCKIKILRTDNGGEYVSNMFESFLRNEGIKHEKTVPKTPQQNGVSERMNRTLIEVVRCMLSDAKLDKSFWAEAVTTATYVRNRCPAVALGNTTPYEALFNRKPNVNYFRTFGCICYPHIPKDERSKLDDKAKCCVFLGYSDQSKAYRVYDVKTKKIIISRDVVFHESQRFGFHKENSTINSENT